jgi:hypothetical protein
MTEEQSNFFEILLANSSFGRYNNDIFSLDYFSAKAIGSAHLLV